MNSQQQRVGIMRLTLRMAGKALEGAANSLDRTAADHGYNVGDLPTRIRLLALEINEMKARLG